MALSGEGPYRVRSVKIRSLQDFAVSWVVGKKVFSGLRFVDPHGRNYLPDSIYFTLVLSFPGSDYSEETEGGQKEDGKEEEYIPSQHPTGIKQCQSCMNL